MKQIADYFFVFILSFVMLLELLRIIKIFFNPSILKSKVYDFPERKITRVLYLLCSILVYVVVVLLTLDLI
jgi:hypothetical protein